jgi:alpha-beta hydrolase superfamily lysophospholipase
MNRVKKGVIRAMITYAGIYIVTVVFFIFTQEKFFFNPEKLQKDFKFNFPMEFKELNIKVADGATLNGIIFKADTSKGLVFYLHGNGGCLKEFGEIAKLYTDLKYDLFVLDYRGYGKSDGSIENQEQLFKDIQSAYDTIKSIYDERNIIIYGYSLGSGLAAKLASTSNPRLLILQAPYYSYTDMFKHRCPVIPTFLVRYTIETDKYIRDCKMPIIIFHGDKDNVIYYKSSIKLKKLTKPGDKIIILPGQGHTNIIHNQEYLKELKKILQASAYPESDDQYVICLIFNAHPFDKRFLKNRFLSGYFISSCFQQELPEALIAELFMSRSSELVGKSVCKHIEPVVFKDVNFV